jgi:hypothetical protein
MSEFPVKDLVSEIDGKRVMHVQLTGSNMEYYGKSTDTKPTAGVKIGSTFLEIDTKQVYIFDGTNWVVF